MIYTSYYACPLINRKTMHLVQISNSVPKGFVPNGKLNEAIPDWKTIVEPFKAGLIDAIQYRKRYIAALDQNSINLFIRLDNEIKKVAGKDIVLLCYEKSSDFCHRHILAEYINENIDVFGVEVEELADNEPTLF